MESARFSRDQQIPEFFEIGKQFWSKFWFQDWKLVFLKTK